jgi:hypothetical protein
MSFHKHDLDKIERIRVLPRQLCAAAGEFRVSIDHRVHSIDKRVKCLRAISTRLLLSARRDDATPWPRVNTRAISLGKSR